MKTVKLTSKSYMASWFSTVMAISLLLLVIFSEFFQNITQNKNSLDLLSNPIRADIIANINTIKISNRIGNFVVTQQDNQWLLKEPRVMPAKISTINKVLEALKSVNINTIHQYEPINIQNFSLDKPIMVIELYSKLEEKLQIKVGLINPINNTSYITVSGNDTIYQIELLKNSIELLKLSDFIESSIFSTPIEKIAKFEIFRRGINESYNSLVNNGSEWKSKRYKTIRKESVDNKLNTIFSIKTHMIVDKQDEKLNNLISNYMSSPLYTIKIETVNKKVITYKVSSLVKAIPELKLSKRNYFIMTSSSRKYPYIIEKNYLNEFAIRYSDFK